jgi:hypothetical protein
MTAEPMSDAAIDPKQPRRLEKNTNIVESYMQVIRAQRRISKLM